MTKEIPALLKKKQLTVKEMFNDFKLSGGMKKGEMCVLFAKPDCGKTNFTEQNLRDFLKEKQ